jgi:hypothetical protein
MNHVTVASGNGTLWSSLLTRRVYDWFTNMPLNALGAPLML